MATTFRTYVPEPRFGEDYAKMRAFLLRLDSSNYSFGRWDWMMSHFMLDAGALDHIGLWEDAGEIVAAATYDCYLGSAYLLMDTEHRDLAEELLLYAQRALARDGKFRALILDGDTALQHIAAKHGFIPTQDKECDAVYPIEGNELSYSLPDGFRIVSMADEFDLRKYAQVMWNGFERDREEGPFVMREADWPMLEAEFRRPNVSLDLKIAVAAPGGDFVSYCGMWHDPRSGSALVEPVATDPAYRKLGLGRAAVLEGIRRCAALGAKRAFVGSSQQFYYRIGFRPFATSTWWEQPESQKRACKMDRQMV